MKKELRQLVLNKYGGKCAYCGCDLDGKGQVDHIVPVNRGRIGVKNRLKEMEHIDHLNPACGRCNRYKATMGIELFRSEIAKQVDRARKKSWNFRIAEDFGLVKPTNKNVLFYFEEINKK